MSTSVSSIPSAIRDCISAPAHPHVWIPEDFGDLGRARRSIRPSTGWLLPATFGVSLAAFTTPPRTTGSRGSLHIPINAT